MALEAHQGARLTPPAVSVCIPSHNYAQFLPEAVESVLGQSHRDLELVIFDDGSSDGSFETAQRYASEDGRVRVATHPGRANRGIVATLNASVAEAGGGYVAFLAADDVLGPDSVERRLGAIHDDPAVAFVYGRIETLDADGRPTGRISGHPPDVVCGFNATDDLFHVLLLRDFVPAPSVLLRRSAFEEAGGFDERLYYCDWELWIRLMARFQTRFLGGAPLAGFRVHGNALTQEYADADLPRRLEVFRALDEKGATVGGRFTEPRVRALVSLQRAAHAAQLGLEPEARSAIASAFGADPALRRDAAYLFWWLGRLQGERIGRRPRPERSGWLGTLSTAAGASEGDLACWLFEAARGELAPDAAARVAWGLIGDELERTGSRPRPGIVLSCIGRGVREPGLLRERRFAKAVIAAAGAWPLAARARRLAAR
jgi:glycosyltransferase involved in cell wall biosynthesis